MEKQECWVGDRKGDMKPASEVIHARMTEDRARKIRYLRSDCGYSWRAVAEQTAKDWGVDCCWNPVSSQIAGAELCDAAAEMLGEDCSADPWN